MPNRPGVMDAVMREWYLGGRAWHPIAHDRVDNMKMKVYSNTNINI